MHPSKSWDELVTSTTVLYEEARLARLGTEKFMLDGRHTGTGGGNHIVLGGPTPGRLPAVAPARLAALAGELLAEPPLALAPIQQPLHRPDRAKRPRVDEARNDSLYELDIAFRQDRPIAAGSARPGSWTACSATCSLTPPATRTAPSSASTSSIRPTAAAAGSGLLEMRAFEMPPHARMSLAQQLLLRAPDRASSGSSPTQRTSSAGAPTSTTAGCCRTSSGAISAT